MPSINKVSLEIIYFKAGIFSGKVFIDVYNVAIFVLLAGVKYFEPLKFIIVSFLSGSKTKKPKN